MMHCSLTFAGNRLELYGEGVAWFPDHRILCASDIHFEKGTFFQRFSTLLPPYDTFLTLSLLQEAIIRFKPRLFISLGDAFHDKAALQRMPLNLRTQLNDLIASVEEWIWVEGNHDTGMQGEVGGTTVDTYQAHNITFRHIAEPASDEWEFSGHYHPKARVSIRGHSLRLPCFVRAGKRLLFPAFGSYTGGMDVTSEAICAAMPPQGRQLYLLHNKHVFLWQG